MRLSICIATFRRAAFIGTTLDSILPQLGPDVELLVVDGASPDHTEAVMREYQARHPSIRYIREPVNSGVDRDYDRAVEYARGDYCWLMTDDDLMAPGAVERVLAHLDDGPDAVIVNSEVRNADLSRVLQQRLLDIREDRVYEGGSPEALFTFAAPYLSFIGGVIVRREWWLARERASFYGSLFIHVGVIFQEPAPSRVRVLASPLLSIRYGNALWTARGFEIWMFKWPHLVWNFTHLSSGARASVCAREPWRSPKMLLYHRAIGAYDEEGFFRFIAPRSLGLPRILARLAAVVPGWLAAFTAGVWIALRRGNRRALDDIARSRHARPLTRWLIKRLSGG